MGVTGLWRLIEPAGKPVPVETLENKVLAVDISIWLHQMVKGYQDAKGAPLPNAHLIGLFQRLCKLLYFRIKPVFVFDGAFPALKKETIAKRQDNKQKYNSESERLKRELAILLTKKTAISTLLGKQISPTKKVSNGNQNDDDIFKLPALPENEESELESEDEASTSSGSVVDLHSIDLESKNFKSLQPKDKYDLLLELKETRKMNSWGKLHELPKKSDNFSDFQLQRLLKRRKVQECLEETEKEIGDAGMSLNELESLLNEEGIDTKIDNLPTKRIASNNTTRYLLISDVKQALANAKKKKVAESVASTSEINETNLEENIIAKKDELEEDLEKAIKMSLECTNEAENSACTSKTDDSWTSYISDSEYSKTDSEEEDGCEAPDMSSAKAYIMQYCDFTDKAIDKIVSSSVSTKSKNKKPKLSKIIEEINNEKSVISSSDDGCKDQNTDLDVQLNTTTNSDILDENVDARQASVIVVENKSQEVITLDSSLEESPVFKKTNLEKLKSNTTSIMDSTDDHILHKENLYEIRSHTSVLQTVPKTSLQFPSGQHNIESSSSDNAFDDIPQKGETMAESRTPKLSDNWNEESDSSDDFEDVPEIDNKLVVQLTLDKYEAPEDDIFADVFAEKPDKIKKNIRENIAPNFDSKREQVTDNQEDDDELQKAIMMSLECAIEDNVPVVDSHITRETHTKDKEPTVINTTGNNIPKPSKSLESLNEIISAQSSEQTVKEINKHSNKTTKEITKETTPLSTEQLNDMVEEIQMEEQDLLQEKGRMDRVGRNITEQMTKEAQELLQIFGIPYIVAPMEAEAQCAFLESVNLTDGTITDDSDIWLFGGRTVYKNFFNQKKHVLQFISERIEKSFNLNREQLILLALLVGSDYTTGVAGVGPVTALEILASFPFNKRKLMGETTKQARYLEIITGLQEFKHWVRGGKRTDNTSLKKKLRNISLNDDFPSVRVVQAYLEPNIEKNEEKFSWGEIDITILRDYTKAKFGWSQQKLDEIIKPVLKRLVERKSQKSMQDYFKKKINFQSLEDQMSKRVKAAVQRMGPELLVEDQPATSETKPKKRKGKETEAKAGPSKGKKRTEDSVLKNLSVQVVSELKGGKSEIDIKINKTDRFQEIIPQREKDKQSLLQNKMKAIELFRKTKIDKKKKTTKRKPILPKERAELSESSDSN